jgi:hypothetical protein
MRKIKSLVAGCVFSLFLSITVLAGDMPGPGKAQTPPKQGSTTSEPTTCTPVIDATGQVTSANVVCTEATPNLITEATIIAIQLITGVW